MERIVLRHLSGSRANQADLFPLSQFKEIILGRDPSSTVRFSDEAEVMVGRHHARITRNPALPSLFLITDLKSRNGTFVNQARIFGTASLKPGDVVQCGTGGPEFQFTVELETGRPGAGPAPVEGRSHKGLIVGGGFLMGLIALGAGFLVYRGIRSSGPSVVETPSAAPQPSASPDSSVAGYSQTPLSGGAAAPTTLATSEAGAVAPSPTALVKSEVQAESIAALPAATKKPAAPGNRSMAPRARRVTRASSRKRPGGSNVTRLSSGKTASKSKAAVIYSGDALVSAQKEKKEKKAKKEKKMKNIP